MNNCVSKELKLVIDDLMKEPLLNEFNLGGGTNLALKYNHRVSTDIDLFSPIVVGKDKISKINQLLSEKYKSNSIDTSIRNKDTEHLSLITAYLQINNVPIKVDIIQNLPLNNPIEKIDNIRLISDLDIGALKLLAIADRGKRKDFYDAYMLSKKYGLSRIYDELMVRNKKFDGNKMKYQNIFTIPDFKPKETLEKSITALGNFNNAGDLKDPGNRIVLGDNAISNVSWPTLKRNWIDMLMKLSIKKDVSFKAIPNQRKNRGLKF